MVVQAVSKPLTAGRFPGQPAQAVQIHQPPIAAQGIDDLAVKCRHRHRDVDRPVGAETIAA